MSSPTHDLDVRLLSSITEFEEHPLHWTAFLSTFTEHAAELGTTAFVVEFFGSRRGRHRINIDKHLHAVLRAFALNPCQLVGAFSLRNAAEN